MIFSDARAWYHGLVHPFYVPSELHPTRVLLAEGRISAAIGGLFDQAVNGHHGAAATLAYICLRDPGLAQVDREAVAKHCRISAIRSDKYAQYVVACQEYEQGNFKEYSRWLHRAARNNFSPALGDVARALMETTGRSSKHLPLAKRYLMRAIVHGHLSSIIYLLRACKDGKFGWSLSILGLLAFPVVLMIIAAMCRMRPFDVSFFSHPYGVRKPLFALLDCSDNSS